MAKVKRSVLVDIFLGLGFKTAKTWGLEKLQSYLPHKLKAQVDEETKLKDEALDGTLRKILTAIDAEEEVTIVDDAAAAAPAEEAAPAPAKKAAKPAPVDEDEEEVAPAPAKKAKAAPVAEEDDEVAPAPKAAKAAAPADDEEVEVKAKPKPPKAPKSEKPAKAPKEPKPPKAKKEPGDGRGVRTSRSRPYLAGIIIKKNVKAKDGQKLIDTGVTPAMVAELDAAYGKENPAESMFCLRNAWHSIRGYITRDNEGDLEMAAKAAPEAAE